MSITRDEVIDELKGAHLLLTNGARKVLALLMKVQNLPEGTVLHKALDATDNAVAYATDGGVSATQAAVASSANTAANAKTMELYTPHELAASRVLAARIGERVPDPEDLSLLRKATVATTGHAPHPYSVATTGALLQEQKAVFTPQVSIVEVDEAPAPMSVQAALDNAKSVFKQALKDRGLPEQLATLADRVTLEDLAEHQAKAAVILPTEEVAKPVVEKPALLARFIGPNSVFSAHLHADVMFHATGVLKPGFQPEDAPEPLKKYGEDARWMDETSLRHWPTGFYTDRSSKITQFLVNTDQAAFLVNALPTPTSPVEVYVYGGKQGYRMIQDFELSELHLLHAKLSDKLEELVKKKG